MKIIAKMVAFAEPGGSGQNKIRKKRLRSALDIWETCVTSTRDVKTDWKYSRRAWRNVWPGGDNSWARSVEVLSWESVERNEKGPGLESVPHGTVV